MAGGAHVSDPSAQGMGVPTSVMASDPSQAGGGVPTSNGLSQLQDILQRIGGMNKPLQGLNQSLSFMRPQGAPQMQAPMMNRPAMAPAAFQGPQIAGALGAGQGLPIGGGGQGMPPGGLAQMLMMQQRGGGGFF